MEHEQIQLPKDNGKNIEETATKDMIEKSIETHQETLERLADK